MSDSAEKFWNRFADRYARSAVSDPDSYEKKLENTQNYLNANMSILEIGCGTGTTALRHAPFVAEILATDLSPRMIEIAKEKAVQEGVENVDFQVGTLESLASDQQFDAILALNILHLLSDLGASLACIRSHLKPGGVFVSSTVCIANRYGFFRYVAPLGRMLGLMPPVNVFDDEHLRTQISQAGFTAEFEWQHGKGLVLFLIAR